ncbi:30S ribosomal protein S9 [Candidatus Woesearchaeota archaeon]|nr:30S ribosomal protein S9 [Candidatus Woesearchaeota archaeon]
MKKTSKAKSKPKQPKTRTVIVSGKRKTAVARAKITSGTGLVRVNSQMIDHVQPMLMREKLLEPIILCGDAAKKINISVNVQGGGINGQADAARLAIAKAIVEFNNDETLRKKYLDYDRTLLVADVRRKEMCKPNDSKARAKRQKSYR